MKCGIVGLPNAGKSTLFKALTAIQVAAENYPFCTIEPNVGTVQVPDERVKKLSNIFKPQKSIYPIMEFMDIAGLIKGASKGEGLGHQFLSHIRESHALLHVVRCFENKNITHVYSNIDPCRDISIIESELLLSDLSTVQNRLNKIEKNALNDSSLKPEVHFLKRLLQFINQENKVIHFELTEEEKPFMHSLHLLTAKPVLYVCNIDESNLKYAQQVKDQIKGQTIFISCQMESELNALTNEEKKEYLGDQLPALSRLIRKSYSLLDLMTFFTAGEKEVRSWTAKNSTLAPQAAGLIHSDFEKGFIRAEVYSCSDLFQLGSIKDVKEKGLYRIEGKNYTVKDGDVVLFRFNV